MYRLTEPRFQKAKAILDRYNAEFLRTRHLNTTLFEKELKDAWDLDYQELKPIMIELSKRREYSLLAVRYMEGSSPGAVSEFKPTLAAFYGMERYDTAEREAKQREFWESAFGESTTK